MNILYVGKHNSGGNDDEGAIAHALDTLGHKVTRIQEKKGIRVLDPRYANTDLVLFHKWYDLDIIKKIPYPKVFWYFDLVNYADNGIQTRCQERIRWMHNTTPYVDLGFCTDGDWVNQDRTKKLICLRQGADIRKVGMGTPSEERTPILFTGIKTNAGNQRANFVATMASRYGNKFLHKSEGVYGKELADLIASSRIVVAPDSPVTDNYWSNRVYLTLGFGGFLLHPLCQQLQGHYTHGKQIIYYEGRRDLYDRIEYYLYNPTDRKAISQAALERTIKEHTYTHRVETLLNIVKERVL